MKKIVVIIICLMAFSLISTETMAISRVEKKCVALNMVSNPKQEKITSFFEGKIRCVGKTDKKQTRKDWREGKSKKIGNITAKQFYNKFKVKEKKYKSILLNRCVVMELSDIYQSGGAKVGESTKDKAVTDCYKMAYDDKSFMAIQQTWVDRRDEKSATTGKTLRNDYKTIEKYYK